MHLCVLGAKFSQTAACTRIIESDGTSLTLESTSGVQHLAPETRELWEYVHEVRILLTRNRILCVIFPVHNKGICLTKCLESRVFADAFGLFMVKLRLVLLWFVKV